MTYKVVLVHTNEGYSVYAPGLPGCASQGETEQQALSNISDAIKDYIEVQAELKLPVQALEVYMREVQVA